MMELVFGSVKLRIFFEACFSRGACADKGIKQPAKLVSVSVVSIVGLSQCHEAVYSYCPELLKMPSGVLKKLPKISPKQFP
jgi:hypothetical protein